MAVPSRLGIALQRHYDPAMLTKPLHPSHDVPEAKEIRISREGSGRNSWRWSIWQGSTLLARAPTGFPGAEAAYEAGRRVLKR